MFYQKETFLQKRYDKENATIVFASSIRFEKVPFDHERSISKPDLRSVQGQVMAQEGQYA